MVLIERGHANVFNYPWSLYLGALKHASKHR